MSGCTPDKIDVKAYLNSIQGKNIEKYTQWIWIYFMDTCNICCFVLIFLPIGRQVQWLQSSKYTVL